MIYNDDDKDSDDDIGDDDDDDDDDGDDDDDVDDDDGDDRFTAVQHQTTDRVPTSCVQTLPFAQHYISV